VPTFMAQGHILQDFTEKLRINMKYNQLGQTNTTVSEICLGTMTFGEQNTEKEAHEQLDHALAAGINFFDAAEMYPVPPRKETQGLTEKYVGSWLAKQDRSKIILATKVAGPGRGMEWVRGETIRLNRKQIYTAVEQSLTRLKTDYIDLYQIHWPERNVPIFGHVFFDPKKNRECESILSQIQVFSDLIKEGKIKHYGLSNETPYGLMEFIQTAQKHSLPLPVSVQNAYSLINRTYEQGLSEISYYSKIGLLAYSPLAFGLLTGKYEDGKADEKSRLKKFSAFGQRYIKVNSIEAVREYMNLARKAGLSPATLALAFVRSKFFTTSTIIGATGIAQLKENIKSSLITLTDDIHKEIDQIHARYPNPAP